MITSTLLALALATGVGVVLVYNNWNGNLDQVGIAGQVKNRPEKVVEGPQEPMNILVMGSDSRAGKGNGIDGETGGGLSDTTILFHLSANREFAYGISIPRDTAVQRPTCYHKDGSEIAGSGETYVKWNVAFAVGGPACTVQQFEQISGVRVDKYVVVDFNGFKDMVNALDGVEVCIPEDINDEVRKIYLKAGTREVKGDEALTYFRVRYRVGDGTDTQRTRRQQAFIGSMINKALTAGMLARPDRLVSFMNAFSSSLKTDFKNIAEMADLAVTARGVGAENIRFVTTPWGGTTKVSGGVEWTPDVEKLWSLVVEDKPLTSEFLKDALSAADKPDGSKPPATGPADPSGSPTDTPSSPVSPSDGASPTDESGQGLSVDGRAAAGLCT
ncbi:LCP family protein [Nocardioides sp. zg-536]|uniref:LCP family protein n=1 Tax=Nocardioides faecalis TaxID=2803858 RepID=A0A938YA17_9ACTN|nr:LCP family protein [Nocardioides faecalis]MBM9460868.1 LCP family protein [Nocardioides faecalis]MBS4751843.1 LCP family protein [Nocardioides faecalis]QVI59303.1 LCP family protein [Nocardioides faecalis]